MEPSCNVHVESAWGPAVASQCLGGFDFTLLFEESILTILPVSLFLLATPIRFWELSSAPTKVKASWLLPAKTVFYFAYICLEAALLGLFARRHTLRTPVTLAACSLTLVAYFFFLALSHLEHRRSWRPSSLLLLFLSLTLLLDMARLRTVWLIYRDRSIPAVLLAAFCAKIVLFGLECAEKRSLLRPAFSPISPEDGAGLYSRLTFFWINPLFAKGFNKILTLGSLLRIDHELLDSSDPAALTRRWARADKSSKYSLLWVYAWHFRWTILAGVPPKLAWVGFTFAQPFLIQRVLDFISNPEPANGRNIAYGLIGAYALVYIGIAVTYAYTEHKIDRLVLKVRGSMVSMIFAKTLRMRSTDASDGSALTLMSADVDRVGNGLRPIHDVWSSAIEVALALWLLERLLGVAVVASALFSVFILVIGLPLGNIAGNAQGLWLEAIEKRLAVTSKSIGAMRGIKMTGAVQTVKNIIMERREHEIAESGKYRWYTALVITIAYLADAFSPVLGFGTFIIISYLRGTQTLTEGIGFASLTLFSLLNSPLQLLISGAEELKTVANCFKRLQEYFTQEEQIDSRAINDRTASQVSSGESLSTASDLDKKEKPSIDSEKSPVPEHPFLISAESLSIAYSPDTDPIIKDVSFTIPRGNITMIVGPVGCGKSTLLGSLIGEAPTTSGKLTTAFRNAAYCPQTPWVKVGSIQQNILGSSLWDEKRYAAVVAACSLDADFAELPDGDQTKTGSRGSRLSGGQQKRVALARALYADAPVLVLDDTLTGLDRTTEQAVLDAVLAPAGLLRAARRSVVLATNTAGHLPYADHIVVLAGDGRVAQQGTYEQLAHTAEYVQKLTESSRGSAAAAVAPAPPPATLQEAEDEVELAQQAAENESRRTGDLRVYLFYFRTAGWGVISLFLSTAVVFVFGISFPTVWVQWWTLANDEHGTHRVGYWLGVYAGLGALSVAATFASSFVLLMLITPFTARRLHRHLLDVTTGATTGWLTATDVGTTTNRFSQDLELVDLDLPTVFETTTVSVLAAVAEGVFVFVGSGYVAAAIPAVFAVLYLIQNFYLRTSRQLRLLDIEARAPLFSTFLEVLTGLSSVRAYGWGADYAAAARRVLDASQKPYYELFTVQRWLTFVLEMLVACVAVLLVGIVTTLRGSSTYLLGTALFNIVSFGGTLEQVITDWTQLEQSIGAVARIKTFISSTPTEADDGGSSKVPEDWPVAGDVTFSAVSASYESSTEPVLKDVSFEVKHGEKVAICGRTGSGKSTLVSTLLRMLDLTGGSITLDNVDIASVSRTLIRERINTLPQEPFFFEGSVRLNVDPQGLAASDDAIIAALQAVKLWDALSERGGLDADLDEEQLSHGQRQLFCLARAMCKPCNVLILDEPTSSVDAETDKLMHQLIEEHFQSHTVIAIAHKLQTVVDYDKVVVLDKGRVLEFGRPRDLLDRPESHFKALFDSLRYAG